MVSPLAAITLALGVLGALAQNHTDGHDDTELGHNDTDIGRNDTSAPSNTTSNNTAPIGGKPYPLNATVYHNITTTNGEIVTIREPHPSALPLRWEGRVFDSPNNASWWVAGSQGRFATSTSRKAALETYWPVFDAFFLLQHDDASVLPQPLNIWLWRPQSDPAKSWGTMELAGGAFYVDVPSYLNASDGYFIRLANVTDPSISYYDMPKFEIKKAGTKESGGTLLAPTLAAVVCAGVGAVAAGW
ncbi:hypothetical protein Q8F55_004719 [Vanrija albida]|uniref:Uncharacterized protein n=1 Tax=Vanrija albida TaxID=181172 RepID=A0ABR3PZQ6_9TREE